MTLSRHPQRRALAAVKAAEFHPTISETIRQLGGGWYFNTYSSLYRRQPAVRAVVDFLARNIAQLNAKAYYRIDATDRREVADHPLAGLLRHPNPQTTRFAHMRDTVADLAVHDRAYWRKIRAGRQMAIVRVPPSKIQLDMDGDRRVYRDAQGNVLSRDSLVVFHGYSPDDDDDGVSPLETLRRVLQEEAAATQHRENMWRNSARQSGFIERPLEAPEWSDTARQRFRTDVEATLAGGSNAGRIGVLEDGMTWNASSFSPEQTQYIEGRHLTYEEVALTYFGPVAGRAFLEATATGSESAHRQVYQDVLGPWLRMLQDEIELQLLPEFEPDTARSRTYIEFNLADKLKGSFEEQGRTLVTAVGVPYMTVNEGRAKINLSRIDEDWADQPVQPLNVMYGGQPAVTVPTADPSTPLSLVASAPLALMKAKPNPPAAAIRRRDDAAKDHADLLRSFFERQERAVLSAKAAAGVERWDRELTADLYLLATQITRESGRLAARQLDGVYDEQRTFAYLAENARIAAESINVQTFDELAEAAEPDEVRHVFEVAKTARADQLGLSRATGLIAFARVEAALHSQDSDGRQRMKTWTVTSAKSRHPGMGGEQVPIDENFSNGLRWPGDSQGSPEETTGCQCLLDLG